MCLFRWNFYEKYDWNDHTMLRCKFQKVNNLTTTTHAQVGAFDYITNGENNACLLMRDSLRSWGVNSDPSKNEMPILIQFSPSAHLVHI